MFGITPIARVPDQSESTILHFPDRGLPDIIVPHVNTQEEAQAGRYHPERYRGVGGGRAHDYWVGVSRAESAAWVNSQTLVVPVVEDTRAVENLDGILSVPGVDVLHVASGDVVQSMGNRHSLPRRVGATRHGLLKLPAHGVQRE